MTIQPRHDTHVTGVQPHSRLGNVVPLRLRHMRKPASITEWGRTVELVLAIEPDPAVAMAWFAGECIAEFGGLTAYDMVCTGMSDQLNCFLRDIIDGQRD
jgi:hypothetical protein